jgi:hypothetical protein
MKDRKGSNHAAQASAGPKAKLGHRARGGVEGGPSRPEEMGPEVLEFIKAMDDYRVRQSRPFPSWSEVLGVLVALGYRKVAKGM